MEFKNRKAYTLAEVLLIMGIVGVVAALTIPNLITKIQEKVLINRLKNTYAIFTQAYKLAVVENGPIEGWDISPCCNYQGATKIYDIFVKHMKNVKQCGVSKGCFATHYDALYNGELNRQFDQYGNYHKGMLINGVSFGFWSGGDGCEYQGYRCGSLIVDLNGFSPPNRGGVDLFFFSITKKGIDPYANGYSCEYQSNKNTNGPGCTAWVLKNENMDYLRRDISQEWNKMKENHEY